MLTTVALTKVDVMDAFSEISVCVAYHLDGCQLDRPPANASDLARVKPEYRQLPGWMAETKHLRDKADMPPKLVEYINFIQNFVGVPIKWIGVGQDRKALVNI